MANPFRDMSVIMQGLVAAAIAVVLVLLGIYLPFSPVAQEKDQVDKAVQQKATLTQEVQQLQVYKQRYGELKQQMDALSKQLDTLKTIVPEEKETDEFIRLLQGAAASSNVQLRRLTAKAVVPKDNNYYEMPFEIQADGPYFNVLDFFGRLSRLSRIINVGDLTFNDAEKAKGPYVVRPGTTVSGTFTATTYFTKPTETAPAAAGAAKAGAKN
ncbi:MAG TPA: type 4a pilus biogenesis protein PilO [Dongiaceae bacterium]|nr:type 4a pilus biogenesis protein PilO [Dongiaceae bacterium]